MDGDWHRYKAASKQLRLLANSADNERDAQALQAMLDDLARTAPLDFTRASELTDDDRAGGLVAHGPDASDRYEIGGRDR